MKEEHLLLLSDLKKLIKQVVLIDYTIIILGGEIMEKLEKNQSNALAEEQHIYEKPEADEVQVRTLKQCSF
ncbi:hypothetical protein C810_04860 [Lachnospiraceae bacterium A2]|nr:hypothetical protein C810_04860 [Lachnospiraceae bacterium A2]